VIRLDNDKINNHNMNTKKAFTLIELLVVIAIIGILSGIIAISLNGATSAAKDAKRKADIGTIRKALLAYSVLNGNTYPTTDCSVNSSCTVLYNALVPTYLADLPKDPNTGTYYSYTSTGSDFTVSSVLSDSTSYSYTASTGFSGGGSTTSCGSTNGTVSLSTPSTNLCSPSSSPAVTADAYTVLLLHMDGPSFSDQTGKTITNNGGVAISTSNTKFGNSSAQFNGGNYLSAGTSTDWDLTGAFTIDTWVKPTVDGYFYLVGTNPGSSQPAVSKPSWYFYLGTASNTVDFGWTNGYASWPVAVSAPATLDPNIFYHVAITRDSSNDIRVFVNGVQAGSTINNATSMTNTSTLGIGGVVNSSSFYGTGYMDEVRISKGIARWTTNFTPPNAPYYWWNWTCDSLPCGANKYAN